MTGNNPKRLEFDAAKAKVTSFSDDGFIFGAALEQAQQYANENKTLDVEVVVNMGKNGFVVVSPFTEVGKTSRTDTIAYRNALQSTLRNYDIQTGKRDATLRELSSQVARLREEKSDRGRS